MPPSAPRLVDSLFARPAGAFAPSSFIQIRPPPAPQQNELSRFRGISTSSSPSAASSSRCVVDAVVATERARVVVRHAVAQPPRLGRPRSTSSSRSWEWWSTSQAPPKSGYSFLSVLYVCGSERRSCGSGSGRSSRRSPRPATRRVPPRPSAGRRCRPSFRRRGGSRSRPARGGEPARAPGCSAGFGDRTRRSRRRTRGSRRTFPRVLDLEVKRARPAGPSASARRTSCRRCRSSRASAGASDPSRPARPGAGASG